MTYKNSRRQLATATLISLLLSMFVGPGIVTAQPAGNPPAGNIDARFNTVKALNTGGVIVGEDKTGTANTPGLIKLWSAGDNAFFTSFTTDTQTDTAAYTLPPALPGVDSYLKSTSAGVLTWSTASVTETDPTLIDDGAVTIGAGSGAVTLTFNADAGTDGTIYWNGSNDYFRIIAGDYGTLFHNYGGSSRHNLFFGDNSGNTTQTAYDNIGMGANTLTDLSTGYENVAIGLNALTGLTTGYNNTVVGHEAAQGGEVTGRDNSVLGNQAMAALTSGSHNTAIGSWALKDTNTATYNTAVGAYAGQKWTGGSTNTALGSMAGPYTPSTGTGNVYLGYDVGPTVSSPDPTGGSNKLWIDNSRNDNPLIQGDFSTDALTINGTLGVKGANGITAGEDKAGGTSNTPGKVVLVSNGDNALSTTIQAGTQTVNSTLTLPTGAPAADTYLKSDGSGNLSWSAASVTEADTLDSVTDRNATTNNSVTVGNTLTVGDAATGNKTVSFDGTNDGTLVWDSVNSQLEVATGSMGVGTTDPINAKLEVNSGGSGNAIYGKYNTDIYGWVGSSTYGVYGQNAATNYGYLGAATYGVYGRGTTAVYGLNNGGSIYGSLGSASSGVYGYYDASNAGYIASSTTGVYGQGTNYGVYGANANTAGGASAVRGVSSGATGVVYGVYGDVASTSGKAVYGNATSGTGGTVGVQGTTASTGGWGVYGNATAVTGTNYGVQGTSASASGYGVVGTASSTTGTNVGVYGSSASNGGYGGYFANTNAGAGGAALYASATAGYAALFNAGNVGIGTLTPGYKLEVNGSTHLGGSLYDVTHSAGASGNILSSTGSGISWIAAPTIHTQNTDTGTDGTNFTVGDGVTNFTVDTSGTDDTINIEQGTYDSTMTFTQNGSAAQNYTFTNGGTVCTTGAVCSGYQPAGTYGDIESVGAGNGLTGGGTSGAVTLDAGAGTGISVAADAIALDYTATLAGNPALSAGLAVFDGADSGGGILFEGAADALEGLLTVASLTTADKTWTLQDNSGVIPLGTAGNSLFFTTSGNTSITLPTSGTVLTSEADTLATVTTRDPVTTNDITVGNSLTVGDASGPVTITLNDSASDGSIYFDGATNKVRINDGDTDIFHNGEGGSNDQIFIGEYSGNTGSIGPNNYGIGYYTLNALTTGYENIAIGLYTMINNEDGNNNTAVGHESLGGNVSGDDNTVMGNLTATGNTSGSGNTALGSGALRDNSTGNYNVAVGVGAGSNFEGSNNVAVGVSAGGMTGATGSGNVYLGYQAGYNATGDNKLYLDNSSTATPLIYGDFSTDALTINGSAQVTGSLKDTSGDAGAAGDVLSSLGGTSGTNWIASTGLDYANKALSNLASVAINTSLLPGADDSIDLGSSDKRWQDLYLGPTSLHLKSTAGETGTARDWKLGIQETVGSSRGNLRMLEGSNELMNVTPGGNVGIGTTTPGSKLTVYPSDSTNAAGWYYGNEVYRTDSGNVGAGVSRYNRAVNVTQMDNGTHNATASVSDIAGYFYSSGSKYSTAQGLFGGAANALSIWGVGGSVSLSDDSNLVNQSATSVAGSLAGTLYNTSSSGGGTGYYLYDSSEFLGSSAGPQNKGMELYQLGVWNGDSYGTKISNNKRNNGAAPASAANKYGLWLGVGSGGNTSNYYANSYGLYVANTDYNSVRAATKYGAYIRSDGTYDGGAGATTNYGLYVDTSNTSTADSEYTAIFMGDNVGIGTATPWEKLHVYGSAIIDDGGNSTNNDGHLQVGMNDDRGLVVYNYGAGGGIAAMFDNGMGNSVQLSDDEGYGVNSQGDIRTWGVIDAVTGNIGDIDAGDATLDVLNNGTSTSFRVDDDVDNDTTPFIIDNAGNVGIGTATPTYKLDVNGNSSNAFRASYNANMYAVVGGPTNTFYAQKDTQNFGYIGRTDYGIWGEGTTAVYGRDKTYTYEGYLGGSTVGAYGGDTNGGPYGYLGSVGTGASGVYDANIYGYLGTANYGAYGQTTASDWGALGANQTGVWGHGELTGVYGVGDNEGVYGTSSVGNGVYGYTSAATGIGGYFVNANATAGSTGLFATANSASGLAASFGTGKVRLGSTLNCNGGSVLETDANGDIQCGADAGGTETDPTWTNGGNTTNAISRTGTVSVATAGTANAITGSMSNTAAGSYAVKGDATGASGATYGVYGSNASSSGYGIYGVASNTSGAGVVGNNSGSGTNGYIGGRFYGVYGQYDASNTGYLGGSSAGVSGTGTSYGVYGTSGASGTGGYFVNSSSGTALYAASGSGYGAIINGGDVGIGTPTPTARLHVIDNDTSTTPGSTWGMEVGLNLSGAIAAGGYDYNYGLRSQASDSGNHASGANVYNYGLYGIGNSPTTFTAGALTNSYGVFGVANYGTINNIGTTGQATFYNNAAYANQNITGVQGSLTNAQLLITSTSGNAYGVDVIDWASYQGTSNGPANVGVRSYVANQIFNGITKGAEFLNYNYANSSGTSGIKYGVDIYNSTNSDQNYETQSYGLRVRNSDQNAVVAATKYGAYIQSTGSYLGGANTTNNTALSVQQPSGADNNYAATFMPGLLASTGQANGGVGIGTTTPLYPLHVTTAVDNAIVAYNTLAGNNAAVIYGINQGTTGGATNTGVRGDTAGAATGSSGVYGYASSTTGSVYGVYGTTPSSSGSGVYGYNTGATGTGVEGYGAYGVYGGSATATGTGVTGNNTAASGNAIGVSGSSPNSASGVGVWGSGYMGLKGYATTYGAQVEGTGTSGYGIDATATSSTGTTYGVYGTSYSDTGYGGYFRNVNATSGTALLATAANAIPFRANDDGTATDSTAFIVDAAGSVGVQDSTPSYDLDVNGDFAIATSGTITTSGAGVTYNAVGRSYLKLNPSSATTVACITGVAAGEGKILILENINTSFTVTLNHAGACTSPNFPIYWPTGVAGTAVAGNGQSYMLILDASMGRWVVVSFQP